MLGNVEDSMVKTSVSGNKLTETYGRLADKYFSKYPEVRNPAALLEGISKFVSFVVAGAPIPDHTLIYVLEDGQENMDDSRYLFLLSRRADDNGETEGYNLHILYVPEAVQEGVSVFGEDYVVWSSDTMEQSKHPLRTKYYMGFIYKLCELSPGFDKEPEPETEISIEELLTYVTGTLPPELIDIKLPEETEVMPEKEPTAEAEKAGADGFEWESDLFEGDGGAAEPVPEHDDVEVTMVTPEEYEEEYDDLQTDYEELFE